MEVIEQWMYVAEDLYIGRTKSGSVCIAFTDGKAPNDGGTLQRYTTLDDGIWGTVVLAMTAFGERPNDWHAFLDHHLGRRDLMDAAKDNQTLRNVVRRQLDALRHAKAALDCVQRNGFDQSGVVGSEVLNQVAGAIISGERMLKTEEAQEEQK